MIILREFISLIQKKQYLYPPKLLKLIHNQTQLVFINANEYPIRAYCKLLT